MAVTAQAHLWRDCSAGCLHCPPAARDEAGTAARDHPRCGEEEVCPYACGYGCSRYLTPKVGPREEDISAHLYLVPVYECTWVHDLRYVNCMYKSIHESMCVYPNAQECQGEVDV